MDFVRDNPGEPVPEETFTHSHLSWSPIVPYLLHHLIRSMASSPFSDIPNGSEYRNAVGCINSGDDLATSCKNLVNCCLVTPEFTRLNTYSRRRSAAELVQLRSYRRRHCWARWQSVLVLFHYCS